MGGRAQETVSLSKQANIAQGGESFYGQRMSVAELEKPEIRDQLRTKPMYFLTNAYITIAKKDNALYESCPDCKKKISGMVGWRNFALAHCCPGNPILQPCFILLASLFASTTHVCWGVQCHIANTLSRYRK